jgi:1,4-dihydroxy-2-naphthoyl-CoA hydrolase
MGMVPVVDIPLPYRPETGFEGLFGLEILAASSEEVCARVEVRDDLKQSYGLVHGGVYASLAESITSMGTAWAVAPQGRVAVGLANQTSFLRPITQGTIHAVATPRHRGRSTWVWDVEITDDAGRVCVLTRMTVAVRDAPAQQQPAAS